MDSGAPASVDAAAIAGAADGFAELAASRLRELVELESPSRELTLLARARDDLARRLSDLGAEVTCVPGPLGDHIHAVVGPGAASASIGRLLLLGHYDTVWPEGEVRRRPFVIEDGYARGPGVFDMKGSLVMVELALKLMREGGLTANRIELLIVADEEISSPTGRDLVREAAQRSDAVIGLEPPHPDGALKTARRGVATARLSVAGRESHAGLDAAAGVSATDELVDQLIRLREELLPVPGLAVNLGTLEGGSRPNVVAGRAVAEIGLRFSTAEAQERLTERLGELEPCREGATSTLELVTMRPIWEEQPGNRLVAHVQSIASQLGIELDGRPAGGGGDANFTGSAGIPTVDGLGPTGHGAHAVSEAVSMESILRRAELLSALVATPLPKLR